jgi:hypothetical protein
MSVRNWPKIAAGKKFASVGSGHLAAPGVSILKVSFLVSCRSKFPEHQLWVLTHRDLNKSTRIRITTDFLYRELKPFFSIH